MLAWLITISEETSSAIQSFISGHPHFRDGGSWLYSLSSYHQDKEVLIFLYLLVNSPFKRVSVNELGEKREAFPHHLTRLYLSYLLSLPLYLSLMQIYLLLWALWTTKATKHPSVTCPVHTQMWYFLPELNGRALRLWCVLLPYLVHVPSFSEMCKNDF